MKISWLTELRINTGNIVQKYYLKSAHQFCNRFKFYRRFFRIAIYTKQKCTLLQRYELNQYK